MCHSCLGRSFRNRERVRYCRVRVSLEVVHDECGTVYLGQIIYSSFEPRHQLDVVRAFFHYHVVRGIEAYQACSRPAPAPQCLENGGNCNPMNPRRECGLLTELVQLGECANERVLSTFPREIFVAGHAKRESIDSRCMRVVELAAGQSVARQHARDQVRFAHAPLSLDGTGNLPEFSWT